MKTAYEAYNRIVASVPKEICAEVDMKLSVSDNIWNLMVSHNLDKKQFAKAIGKRPSVIAKWISGQYNFDLETLALISDFFGEPIIK